MAELSCVQCSRATLKGGCPLGPGLPHVSLLLSPLFPGVLSYWDLGLLLLLLASVFN